MKSVDVELEGDGYRLKGNNHFRGRDTRKRRLLMKESGKSDRGMNLRRL